MEDQGRKSAVWKYFKLDGKKAECQLCKANLSFCGGTTNLRNHMSNRHSGISLTSNKQHQNKKKQVTGARSQLLYRGLTLNRAATIWFTVIHYPWCTVTGSSRKECKLQ
ncbi:uncharacterized protein LOC143257216 [Tachypleus tridentatus]|uniref:uncharacterized protein LOC143231582 n=1 Tax=Tachypleus tridentatus TaxID=6853 RepID=UPI003FD1709E